MPTDPARRARLLVPVLAAGSIVALAGCASPGTGGDDEPAIVATTTQVTDFATQLAGEQAEVTGLLQPGQSAHSFDPSAAQLLALGSADALVVNGGGLESWLDDAIAASGFDGVLIDASTGIELAATEEEHTAGEPDHAEGDEHSEDHDHGAGNPHIWTDPALAEHMVANIADGLAEVDGIDDDALRASEADYSAKLQALDAWITENVDTVPVGQRLLVTNHDAFTYFLDAYDVTFVGSVIPSFDDNAEPSAAEIDALVARIQATGVKAVFSEASISPKAAETIAEEAGVAVYSGDDALYGDSLGQPGTDGETYLGSQVHNARLILESWGVEPSALPEALRG
ncbi:metal ABC transporter substrate-binding protein [Agromyces aurantiacus]|uniref:Metal ABC transporter substrate-binding protein n=1 Tax=Agromyces aurantiacus TaxID=165814 RepID=A0ABV9R3T7_9MICO|nr:metal ABC transporter substrate-binding protein [Agromyces aurantiacus]MBM7502844.1 zinc/manganese transport system substrate-binding protein/manganese/iron transport system substrate-binding protein [Agromyces aurantiacus]